MSAWRIAAAAPASTPQVGWLTTSRRGSRRISRPTTYFCRLPPDRLIGLRVRLALAHVVGLGDAVDEGARLPAIDEAAPHHRACRMAADQRVLREPEARRGRVAEPLLRHEGRAEPPPLGDREPAHIGLVDLDHVGIARQRLARQRREQLVLPVAGDAREAEDLAGRKLERDAVELDAVRIVRRVG